MGTTLAIFQSFGTLPVFSENWKIILKIGATTSLAMVSFNTLALIPSGPLALFILSWLSNFNMPSVEIATLSMVGWWLGPLFGKSSKISVVKTVLK